jgi:hypothetical protein
MHIWIIKPGSSYLTYVTIFSTKRILGHLLGCASWRRQQMGGVNEYAKFGELKGKGDAGVLGKRTTTPLG